MIEYARVPMFVSLMSTQLLGMGACVRYWKSPCNARSKLETRRAATIQRVQRRLRGNR